MRPNASTIVEMRLLDPADEEALLAWWDRAVALLAERGRLLGADLHVLSRGTWVGVLCFPLAGGWTIITADRRWQSLERERPPAHVTYRQARPVRRTGNPREVSGGELRRWLHERAAGRRDLVLVDTLPRASYAEHHIPGAISLPFRELDERSARAVLGDDPDRTIVVYCSSYG